MRGSNDNQRLSWEGIISGAPSSSMWISKITQIGDGRQIVLVEIQKKLYSGRNTDNLINSVCFYQNLMESTCFI